MTMPPLVQKTYNQMCSLAPEGLASLRMNLEAAAMGFGCIENSGVALDSSERRSSYWKSYLMSDILEATKNRLRTLYNTEVQPQLTADTSSQLTPTLACTAINNMLDKCRALAKVVDFNVQPGDGMTKAGKKRQCDATHYAAAKMAVDVAHQLDAVGFKPPGMGSYDDQLRPHYQWLLQRIEDQLNQRKQASGKDTVPVKMGRWERNRIAYMLEAFITMLQGDKQSEFREIATMMINEASKHANLTEADGFSA